jgi:hypothetical protein
MLVTQAILAGIITSILCTITILASLAHNSRIWIRSAPKAMREASSPLTPEEKRLKLLWSIPVMLAMFGYPIYAAIQYEAVNGAFTFGQAFLFFAIALLIWNLWDLVVVDWFIIVWWHPSIFDLPAEVAHLNHLNNYSFHLKQSLKGCIIVLILSTIVALALSAF